MAQIMFGAAVCREGCGAIASGQSAQYHAEQHADRYGHIVEIARLITPDRRR